MDRTTLAACALSLAPLLGAGCDSSPSAAPSESAPAVLDELKQASPGPWRRLPPVEVAALDGAGGGHETPRALTPADVDDLESRLPPSRLVPPETLPAPAAVPPAPIEALDRGAPDREAAQAGGTYAPAEAGGMPIEPVVPGRSPSEVVPATAPGAAPMTVPGVEDTPPHVSRRRLPSAAEVEVAATGRQASEVTAALKQAGRRVRNGFVLAERNALYLAKGEFVAALELLAQANDLAHDSQFYSESLVAGLAALAESRDFMTARPVGKPIDVARIASGHRTTVVREAAQPVLSAGAAVRRYHEFALARLAAAAAGEPCGSAALFGLAKVAQTDVDGSLAQQLQGASQAQVLYRAALVADPGNYRASNELGVILAHDGDLERSSELLARSAAQHPHPTTLRNLAAVQARLGQQTQAASTLAEAVALERSGHRRGGPAITWVDPATFASTKPASDAVLPPASAAPAAAPPTAAAEQPAVSTARGGAAGWLPWNPRR